MVENTSSERLLDGSYVFKWADGTTSWEKLRDFKESYPVETAEYAKSREIDDEPAFNWWVKSVLQKRDRIISKVAKRQTRYLKKNTKFGIELPKTVAEALALDDKNDNSYWADANCQRDEEC